MIIKLYFAQTTEKTLIIVCPALRSSQSVDQRSDIVDVHMKQREQQLLACCRWSFSPLIVYVNSAMQSHISDSGVRLTHDLSEMRWLKVIHFLFSCGNCGGGAANKVVNSF